VNTFSGSVTIHHHRCETRFTPVLQFRAPAMLLLIILNLKYDCRNSNGKLLTASFVKIGEAHIISYRSTKPITTRSEGTTFITELFNVRKIKKTSWISRFSRQ